GPSSKTQRRSIAPPAYRPQSTPKVLQTKTTQNSIGARQPQKNATPPAAPPVYRPVGARQAAQSKAATDVSSHLNPTTPVAYSAPTAPRERALKTPNDNPGS